MLHLLPEQYITSLRGMYLRRFSVLTMELLAAMCIFGTLSLLPSFLLLRSEKAIIEKRTETILSATSTVKLDELSQFEASLREKISYIESGNQDFVRRLDEILAKRGSIVFNNFQVTANNDLISINAAGFAKTREDLLRFKDDVTAIDGVLGIDIPISFFTKEKDIPFSTIIIFSPIIEP